MKYSSSGFCVLELEELKYKNEYFDLTNFNMLMRIHFSLAE